MNSNLFKQDFKEHDSTARVVQLQSNSFVSQMQNVAEFSPFPVLFTACLPEAKFTWS